MREEIRAFIESNFQIDGKDMALSDDENFFEKRFVNSLFAMRLVQFVEKKTGVEIDSEDLSIKNFCTINRIMETVDRALKQGV